MESKAYAEPHPLVPTEPEAHDRLRKTWIRDLALQKATKQLSPPYQREKSVATHIKEHNTSVIAVKKEIEAGLTEKDLPRLSCDAPDWRENEFKRRVFWGSAFPDMLDKNIEELSQDIEIAAEIEAALSKEIPKNHPDVTAESQTD